MQLACPVTVERRLVPRSCCEVMTVLYLGNEIRATTAHDICAGGVGVMLDQAVDPDTRLTVELFNPRGHFWHRKRLRVIHTTPQPDDRWMLGSTFVQEFTPEELRALLAICRS